MSLHDLKNEIQHFANPQKGKFLQRFFKMEKGEYAEGDVFLGLTVPQSRSIAKKYPELPVTEIKKLLTSRFHEERLIALIILVAKFKKADEKTKKEIVEFYLSHTQYINNWDLVDLSAEYIVGEYVWTNRHSGKQRLRQNLSKSSSYVQRESDAGAVQHDDLEILKKLARSESVWERRIAIISTFAFIKHGACQQTFRIAELLLNDKHDLIHKAVGWMVRETGKRVSEEQEEAFLKNHYKTMPRTMLRYAIERFPEEKRRRYLMGTV